MESSLKPSRVLQIRPNNTNTLVIYFARGKVGVMEVSELEQRLMQHRKHDNARFDELTQRVNALDGKKDGTMSEVRNVFEPGFGYGGGMGSAGGGLGGGALGGFLGAAIGNGGFGFGNNNRNGYGVDGGVVTPMQLASSTASIIDANQNTTLLQAVGETKAAIPVAAQGTQLYVANAMSDLRSHLGQVENSLSAGQMAINKNVSDAIASSLASQNSINMNVSAQGSATRESVNAQGTANLMATKDAQYAIAAAITSDGEKTRAMLVAQNEAALRTEITALQIRLQDQRADALARGTEVNVTQTVNQNQAQAQAQLQAQRQEVVLGNIWERLNGMQQAIATNSNMIIGNSGAVASGPQTSNPINVRT